MNREPSIQPIMSAQPQTLPAPQTPPTQSEAPSQKKSNKTLIIVIIVIVLFVLVPAVIIPAMTLTALGGARDKAKDARIRGDISQERSIAEQYYNAHSQTYVGFTGDVTVNQDIKTQGSEAKIQGVSATTYIIYAQLPSSKKIYCADATGFAGEITSISPDKTTCK